MPVTLHKEIVRSVRYFSGLTEHPLTEGHPRPIGDMSAGQAVDIVRLFVAPFYPEITFVQIREYNPTSNQTYALRVYTL